MICRCVMLREGGASSKHKRCRLLDRPPSRAMTAAGYCLPPSASLLRMSEVVRGGPHNRMQPEHLPGVLGLGLRPLHEFVLIDGENLAVFHENLALHDDGLYVGAARIVRE